MKRAPSPTANGDAGNVQKFVGSAYNNMLQLLANMEQLNAIYENLDELLSFTDSMDEVVALLAILNGIENGRMMGRYSAGTGIVEVITPAQVREMLNVADGATANASDAALRDRSTHTGEQGIETITGLTAALASKLTSASDLAWARLTGVPSSFTPSAHNHEIAGVTGLADALAAKQSTLVSGTNIKSINGETILGSGNLVIPEPVWAANRSSVDFVSGNAEGLLEGMRVTAGRFAGAIRSRIAGDVMWYFGLVAMTLAPQVFSLADRRAFIETAMSKAVVGRQQQSANYTNLFTPVVFPSGKVFFNITVGTTGVSRPTDGIITAADQTLWDADILWQYTGIQVPTDWNWFLLDVDQGLGNFKGAPDSCDSYAAMLVAATRYAEVDKAWLSASSGHPNYTRKQLLDAMVQNNMTDDLSGTSPGPRLSWTFQGGNTGAGVPYDYRLLYDNTETWLGYICQAYLCEIMGESTAAALQNAADVKQGVLGLFSGGRFQTYPGHAPNHLTENGDSWFVARNRLHIGPAIYGMLQTRAEWETYGDAVIRYVIDNTPGLFTESMNDFPMAEWYFAAYTKFGIPEARETLAWRVTNRVPGNVTISDAAMYMAMRKPVGVTNLSYNVETRVLSPSNGMSVTLPIATADTAGLVPASGGGTDKFLRSDFVWAAPVVGGGEEVGPSKFVYFNDFFSTVSDQVAQSLVSNGANGIVVWPFAGNPVGVGFLRQSLNASTGVRAAWGSAKISAATHLRQGRSYYRTFGSLMDLGASRVYKCNLGFVNDHTADPTYGCFFRYEYGVNGGRWEAVTVAGGSPTVVNTGVVASIENMTLFEVDVNAAGTSVDFRIDGVTVATITTTIPGALINLGFTNSIRHVSGTAAIFATLWDYQYVSQEFTGR